MTSNPYEVSQSANTEQNYPEFEGEFLLIPDGIRCHANVQLPPVCLHTCSTEQLQPVITKLRAKRVDSIPTMFRWLIELLIFVVIVIQPLKGADIVAIWLSPNVLNALSIELLICLFLLDFVLGHHIGKGRVVRIQSYICEPEAIRQRLRSWGLLIGGILLLLLISAIAPGNLMGSLGFGVIVLMVTSAFAIYKPLVQIRVSDFGNNWFDVVGFRPEFLVALERYVEQKSAQSNDRSEEE